MKDEKICSNTHECPCVKVECANHGICCECVDRHKELGNLPACLR
jgi:hypothetical protein